MIDQLRTDLICGCIISLIFIVAFLAVATGVGMTAIAILGTMALMLVGVIVAGFFLLLSIELTRADRSGDRRHIDG